MMLYIQYQLHTSWGEPYKGAPQGVKYLNFDQKFTPKIDIMLKYSQFVALKNTLQPQKCI